MVILTGLKRYSKTKIIVLCVLLSMLLSASGKAHRLSEIICYGIIQSCLPQQQQKSTSFRPCFSTRKTLPKASTRERASWRATAANSRGARTGDLHDKEDTKDTEKLTMNFLKIDPQDRTKKKNV